MKNIKKFVKNNWLIILSAIYIFSPLDFVPEFLAPFGIIDDFGVLATTIAYQFLQKRKSYQSEKEVKK